MRNTFFIAFVLLFFSVQSQIKSNFTIDKKLSEITKDKLKTILIFSVKDNNGGIILGKENKRGYVLEHYNNDLKQIKKVDFTLYKYKKSTKIIGAYVAGSKLYLIERFRNFKEKTTDYIANISNMDSINFTKKILVSIPFKKSKNENVNVFSTANHLFPEFHLSQNQKYFTLAIDLVNKKEKEIQFFTYSNQLKKIYQTTFTKSIKERKFVIQNANIDKKDGSFYFIVKTFNKIKNKKIKNRKYQYEIYKVNNNIKNTTIQINDMFIASLTMKQNENHLFCVGFYSDKGNNFFKGTAFFDMDKNTLSLINKNFSPFTKQFFIDKYGSSKYQGKELKHLAIKNIFLTEKNEIVINAEEININSNRIATGILVYNFGLMGGLISSSLPYYLDIVSIKLNTNGEIVWARNINKEQTGGESIFYSYQSIFIKDTNYFILYVNRIKPLVRNRLLFKTNLNTMPDLYLLAINESTPIKYQKIIEKNDSKILFDIQNSILTEDGKSILFQSSKRLKKQVLKLSF